MADWVYGGRIRSPLGTPQAYAMTTTSPPLDRLTNGLFWLDEVRRLTGVSTQLSRRFVQDYKGRRGLWGGGQQRLGRRYYATFPDLMELRIVNAFHSAGVSWRRIRRTAEYARERFNVDFPFSYRRFQTDGREIFVRSDDGLEKVSAKGQFAFVEIIGPSLFEPMEYVDDVPVRWFPAVEWGLKSVGREVMVDPRRSFGAPVIRERSIPTDTLHLNFIAEGREALLVARNYEISENSVWQAVHFEEELKRRTQ